MGFVLLVSAAGARVPRALEKWLKLTTESMVKQSRLVVTTDVTEVPFCGSTDVTLKVQNLGVLPIPSLHLWGEPFLDVRIPFVAVGESAEANFSVVSHEEDKQVDVTIRWECLSLEGDEISGSKDLRFSVATAELAAEIADLGASPYVTGDPVKVDRNDVSQAPGLGIELRLEVPGNRLVDVS